MLRSTATGVLGLTLASREFEVEPEVATHVQALVDRRAALRAARDFAGADAVRGELEAMGVEVTDSPAGTTWRMGG